MLCVKIEIISADYEASGKNLLARTLPGLREDNGEKQSAGLIVRLLRRLDEKGPDILADLLRYLPDSGKSRLISELANHYRENLCDMVNEALMENELGKNISVGILELEPSGEGIMLKAQRVRINYRGVMEHELIQRKIADSAEKYANQTIVGKLPAVTEFVKRNAGAAMKVVSSLAPKEVEKKVLSMLTSSERQEKMAAFLERILEQQGLVVKIGQIMISEDESSEENISACHSESAFFLSEESEELVLDGLAAYLRASVK